MADFYTLFSTSIPCETSEQAEWLCEQLATSVVPEPHSEEEPDTLTALLTDEDVDEDVEEEPEDEDDEDDEEDQPLCEFLNEFDTSKSVWLYSEGDFQIDATMNVLAEMQTLFNIEEPLIIEWAFTASRPILDSYGGGGCLIYKGKTYYFNVSKMIASKLKSLKEAEEIPHN